MLKMGWDIVHNDSRTVTNRLQALALINDSYKYVMDLTTNGVVVTDAINYVQGQMDHLNKSEKALFKISNKRKTNQNNKKKTSSLRKLSMGFFNLCFAS